MKSRITFIVFAVLFSFWAQAKHVTVEKAQSAAQQYISRTTGNVTLRSAQTSSFTLAYTAKKETGLRSAQAGGEDAYFYIFNTPDGQGFIIVAADDRACPVLGYSLKGAFDYDKAPPVFTRWLMNYQEEMEKNLNANPQLEAHPEWQKTGDGFTFRAASTRLGTAEWDQGEPYNRQCPTVGGQLTVTGCVATAMAIVMKYHADHGFAATGTGSHSYRWNGQTLSATFGTYDWANMPNSDYFTNDTQRNAVARLMSHCGISIEAIYGVNGTGAYTSDVAKALALFFGYDASAELVNRSAFSDAAWKSMIKAEIDNNHPVVYNGYGSAGGHAFVCEGYTDNDEYAINWGWGGFCNGFFRLSALQPFSGYSFTDGQGMIIGVKKGSGNTADVNPIWLTTEGGGKGMSKNVENIVQNQQFTVTAGALENTSYSAFSGRIAVVLTDASDKIKEVISTPIDLVGSPLNPHYYYPSIQPSCRITQTIAPTDLIRMASSTDKGVTWKMIKGKTGTVDFLTTGTQSVAVTGVTLNTGTQTLTAGQTFQLTATVAPANATNKAVTWSSSNTAIAEVNASGLVTAKAAGTATVTVKTADGSKTATCAITVQAATVSVTGVSLNSNSEALTVGGTFQLTPTIVPANATNKNVTWSSSSTGVASVDANGLVTAKSTGAATITVTTADGSKTASCAITVQTATVSVTGVSLNSNAETLTEGGTFQLTATIAPSNATNKNVTWTSSNAGVAGVSASGLVTAKAAGTATITVTTADGNKTATCAITVQAATVSVTDVSLNSNAETLTVGGTFQLTATVSPSNATNKNVTWSSNNTGVAQVDANGLVTAKSTGTATVTVTTADGGKTATCTITVQTATVSVTGVSLNSNAQTLTEGGTFQLTATVTPSNATDKSVTWTSNNTAIAEVNASGLVTAKSTGTATVTVTTADGNKTATCTVTVQTAAVNVTGVSLNSSAEALTVGETFQLTATVAPENATNKNVTWTSNNTGVASVDASGLVTAKAGGSATITVKTADGNKTAACVFTVTVPVTGVSLNTVTRALTVGQTYQLTATVAPANATNKAVTWSSSDAGIASVSASGLVTAKAGGSATITVTTADGERTATCAITVTVPVTGVSLNTATQTLTEGETFQLTATIAPANATNQAVTWTSSNTARAEVDASGLVTAKAAGSATITVTTADGSKKASCAVTVKSFYLASGTAGSLTWTLTYDGVLTISGNGVMPDYTSWAPWNSQQILSAVIEDGVTTIGNYAFCDCQKMMSIEIPNSVTSIGECAFMRCFDLKSIEMPANSVKTIGRAAFLACNKMTTVTMMPNSVTTIEKDAFKGCSKLVSLTLPNSLITIGEGAFFACDGLTSVEIPNSVTTIGKDAFYACHGLESVTIPNSVTTIKELAFYDCPKLKSITIPSSVKTVEMAAFHKCTALQTVFFPKSVTTFGERLFDSCSGLKDAYVEWSDLSSVPDVFSGASKHLATLHVPNGTKSIYQASSTWKWFSVIVDDVILTNAPYNENGVTGDESLLAGSTTARLQGGKLYINTPSAERITVYSVSGNIVFNATKPAGEATFNVGSMPKGIYIIRGSSGWTRKVIK